MFFLAFFFFFQLHKFQIHTTRKLQYAYYDNAEYTIMWISRCNNARCVSFDAYLSYACASDMRRSGVHCNHFWIPTRSIGRDTGFKQSSYIRPPLSHYFFFFFFFQCLHVCLPSNFPKRSQLERLRNRKLSKFFESLFNGWNSIRKDWKMRLFVQREYVEYAVFVRFSIAWKMI